jgi:uracil-DNA glycosylase
LETDGDVADGVIACEGRWFGRETLVSFDIEAVTLLGQLALRWSLSTKRDALSTRELRASFTDLP